MTAVKAYVPPATVTYVTFGQPVYLTYTAFLVDSSSNMVDVFEYALIPGLSDTVLTMQAAMIAELIVHTGNLLLTTVFL
jgi:hypothetical protein